MLGSEPTNTPMASSCKVGMTEESSLVDEGRYQRVVEKLIYLSHTKPNIGFSISVVSQFMNNLIEEHLEAVYQNLRYLKMILGKGLYFRKGTNKGIEIFSNANWAGSIIDQNPPLVIALTSREI